MSNVNKRYYWLKLMGDFFNDKRIKKLRKIAGGDTYTIIYLKLLLLSLETEGKLYFEGVEEDFASEIALEIDEDDDNVAATLIFLKKQGLLEGPREDEYFLTEIPYMVGSETASARRVRKMRSQQALQCNTNVTECNKMKQIGNGELEIELEKEIDINLKRNEKTNPVNNVDNVDKSKKDEFTYSDNYIQLLKSSNLSEENIKKILSPDIYKRGIDYLKEKIEMTLLKGDLNANIGYLLGALKNDWKFQSKKQDKIVAAKTRFHNFKSATYTEEQLRKAAGLPARKM